MIKNLIVIFFVLFSLSSFAQQRFNDGRRTVQQRRPQGAQPNKKLPEYDARKSVGLTIYNIEKLTKKIGLKKSDENFSKVTSILEDFNKKNTDLSRINTFSFTEVEKTLTAAQKQAQLSKDYSSLQKAYKDAADSLKGIVKEVTEREKNLDSKLEKLLSKKQFKKWKNYKVKVKKSRK